MSFVIMFSLGYPDEEFREGEKDFNRKDLSKISDTQDERLQPARLAPSSMNSQPWYFVSDGNNFHLYRTKNVLHKILHCMNIIDIGIVLSHMYASYPDTFEFFTEKNTKSLKGYEYLFKSFKI